MALTEFSLVGNFAGFFAGSSGVVTASVEVRPNLVSPTASDDGGSSVAVIPHLILAELRSGVLTDLNGVDLRLYANDPDLNLTAALQYRVSFVNVRIGNIPSAIPDIVVNAPATDVEVDIVSLVPAALATVYPQLGSDIGWSLFNAASEAVARDAIDAAAIHNAASVIQEFNSASGQIALSDQPFPAGVIGVRVSIIAASCGAGSGRRGAAGTVRCGGGGSAGGSVIQDYFVPAGLFDSTWALYIPVGGTGGAAVTTDNTDGNTGDYPINAYTYWRTGAVYVRAHPGNPGQRGTAVNGLAGSNVGGSLTSGVGGAASATGGVGGNGLTVPGTGGGGAGGGISSGNVAANGGTGGACFNTDSLLAIPGGVVDGALPGNGPAAVSGLIGNGTGGGAASVTAAAQSGANGGGFGGGAGGGGASTNGFNSGKGGEGAPGWVRLEWVFE